MMKIIVSILAAGLLGLAGFAPRAEAAAKQMSITFGKYTNRSEVLINFPVLVVLSNNVGGSSGFTFADFVTTNGYDLRFYTNATDTGSGLNYEIESWNTNAGQASFVWVQAPLIPTNGLGSIYAKWGNEAVSNRLACTTNGSVWTNGYIGVWHMAMTNAAGLIPDSSASPHHGANYSTTVTTGMVGYGRSLNGSACIDVTGVTRAAGPITFEYWLRTSSSATPLFLTDCELGRLVTGINSPTAGKVSYYDGTWRAEVGSGLNNGVWHHVVFSLRSGNGTISVDGSVVGTGITYTETAIGGTVIIGGRYSRDLYLLTGDLDEVRISSESRSSNWVWACYLNQASNAFFNGYGTVQTVTSGSDSPAVRNDPVTAVTTNSATFNGLLTSTGSSACAVCVYWGADTNAWANTNWFNGGAVNSGWANNTPFSTNIIGLSPLTYYYYTYGASNTTTNVVASGPVSVTIISLPSVTNLGAQARRTWARLSGQVLSTGGEAPACWFAWWQDGSGTTNTVPMGTQSGIFSTEISPLTAGTTYGYLVAASNSAGTVTSESRNFTTLPSGQIAWYAATNGTDGAGSDWSTAITNLQTVLDTARSNDTIYVAGHAFGLTTQLVWTNSYVTVRGGYAATNAADQPGPSDPTRWPTVIRRASGTTRILYVNGVTNGTLDQVTLTGGNTNYGAGLRIDASSNFLLSASVVSNNAIVTGEPLYGAGIYAGSAASVIVSNCVIRNNTATNAAWTAQGAGIYSAGTLTVLDSVIAQNRVHARGDNGWGTSTFGGGLYFGGQKLTLRNVLLADNVSQGNTAVSLIVGGVHVAAGTADIRNVTMAYNVGIGLRREGGTVGVTNAIFWNNTSNTNGTMTVGYSLFGSDPKFEYGYYLGAGSPATNAGSDTAANLGLQSYAKNAAGATYGGAETVNLGYHYKTGLIPTYPDLYVAPAPLGDDNNNGTNSATPFKTMTKALVTASSGTRIHVASGTYSTNTSETFPLTLSGKAGVQILGTNAALTVLDASGSNARVMYLRDGADSTRIEGVTLRRGVVNLGVGVAHEGAGLRIEYSRGVVLSDCVVVSNAINANTYQASAFGPGIWAALETSVTVSNCDIRNNTASNASWAAQGGGIYSLGTLTVLDSVLAQNKVHAKGDNGWGTSSFGGGIYFGGQNPQNLTLRNVLLVGNEARGQAGYTVVGGVNVAAGTADIRNVTVAHNVGMGLRREGGTLAVTNCIFWQNTTDTNGAMTVGYSLFGSDPLFEYGYYLGAGSPAMNAGSGTAASLGLQSFAKNAAGETYGPAEIINLGYHYKNGADLTYAHLYVAPAPLGDDNNNGTNAATPFKTMTKALATAVDGTRIHVAAGTYSTSTSETFPLTVSGKSAVKILGAGSGSTVFDAAGSGARVLSLSLAHSTLLDGLTLKRGGANGGAGLRIEKSLSVVLSGCVVESNACSATFASAAGIYAAADSSVTLSNCTVRGNTADAPGAGTLLAYGGGIYSLGNLTLRDSVIAQNASTAAGAWTGGGFGGGLYFSGTCLDLRNVLLAGNNASHNGDGLLVDGGTVSMTNVTVAGNSGEGVRRVAGTVAVKDSILWGNGVDSTGAVTLAWTCYSNSADHVNGGNNTNANPLFVDTTYYHLKSRGGNYVGGYFSGGTWANASESSPCIDAGDRTSDYLREPQPNGKRVNLGAYGNSSVASKTKVLSGVVITIR